MRANQIVYAVGISVISLQAQKPAFAQSGTFDVSGTRSGVFTSRDQRTGAFNKERQQQSGVELVYLPGPTTHACSTVATIQVVWYLDAAGQVRKQSDAPSPVRNAADLDKASASNYVIDFVDDESTPYYQDAGNGGGLIVGDTGTSDGNGGGKAAHTSDAPTGLGQGWQKQFETWTVCIAGAGAGDALAGMTWMVDSGGTATITRKSLPAASQHFRDALKSWEKWFNANTQHPPYNEPSGGFRF
jgi:hypothetical protein